MPIREGGDSGQSSPLIMVSNALEAAERNLLVKGTVLV